MRGFVWGMYIMNLEVVKDLWEMEPGGSSVPVQRVMSTVFKTLCVRAFQPNGCLHVLYSPSSRRTMPVLLEVCPMKKTVQDKRQILDS